MAEFTYGETEAILHDVFSATMNPEKGARQEAEDYLYRLSVEDPSLIINLINFAASPPPDDDAAMAAGAGGGGGGGSGVSPLEGGALTPETCVRLAAAVRLRNVIDKGDWNRSGFFPPECRKHARALLLQAIALTHLHDKILRQFVATLNSLVEYDWPHAWPELIGVVAAQLNTARGIVDAAASRVQSDVGLKLMRASMAIVRCCCKKHEDPSKWNRGETDAFAADMVPLLLDILDFTLSRGRELLQSVVDALPAQLDEYTSGARGAQKVEMMFSINPSATALDEVARLALKSCWSLHKNRVPAILCTQDGIDRYCGILAALWQHSRETYCAVFTCKLLAIAPLLRLSPRDVSDEMQQSASWKKMKWIAHIVHHLLCEFILPQNCEQRVRDAAAYFMEQFMSGFAELAVHAMQWHHAPARAAGVDFPAQLEAIAASASAPQKLTCKFFIMCVTIIDVSTGDQKLYETVVHPRSTELLTSLLFERLCFTPEDDELWRWNPEEYIRKQHDATGDLFDPKKVSMGCIYQLVKPSMSFHDRSLLMSFVQFMIGTLEAKLELLQREDGGGFANLSDQDYLEIDACLFAVSQLRRALALVQVDSAMIERIMLTLVVPLLQCPKGFIRARAVVVLARFTKIEWSDPSNYQLITSRVLEATKDEDLPVRIQTCSCLSKFIRHELARPVVEPVVAEIVQHYFSVMRQMDNDGVIRTLRRIIKFYSTTLSQWAVDLCRMIVDHFAVVKTDLERREEEIENEAAAAAEHALSAADGGRDDRGGDGNGGLSKDGGVHDTIAAADELIATMNTLIRSIPQTTSGAKRIFSDIQQVLAPMFHAILGDAQRSFGFMDSTLQLLTDLVSHSDTVDDTIWAVLPLLHRLALHDATDYFSQIVCPLDNFVSVDPGTFLHRRDNSSGLYYIEMFRDMCRHVLSCADLRVRDMASAGVLLDTIFLNVCLRSDDGDNAQALDVMRTLLPIAFEALQHPRATTTFKILFANSILLSFHNSPRAALQWMKENGNCLIPFFSRFVELVLQSEHLHLREYDRKVFLVALIALVELAVAPATSAATLAESGLGECLISLFTSDLLPNLAAQDAEEVAAKARRLHKLLARCARKNINPRTLIKPIGAANFKYIGDDFGDADDEDEELGDGSESDSASETDTDGDDALDGALDDGDDDLDAGEEGEGGGEDGDIESSAQFKHLLAQLESERHRLHAENEDDDEESENLLVDEEVATPIDGINVWSKLGQTLMANAEHPLVVAVMGSDAGQAVLAALQADGAAAASAFDERQQLLQQCCCTAAAAEGHRH